MIFSKINHKLSLIKYIVIFVPVLTLNLIEINPFITVLQIITLIYLVFEILKNYRKLDFFDALIVFFNLYLFAVSATAGTLTFGIVYSIAILTMLTIYTRCELKKSNTVLQAIYVISIVFMLINLYSIALPSTDIYGEVQYFFGGKNAVSISLIPTMFFTTYYSHLNYKKITKTNLAYLMIAIFSMFTVGSGTGTVVASVALIYVLLESRISINPLVYISIYISTQFTLMNQERLNSIPYLSLLVSEKLGKDLTFSSRSDLWTVSTDYIGRNFFGYGKGNNIIFDHYNNVYGQALTESHNMTLELLLTGGVILLLVFAVIVYNAFRYKNTGAKASHKLLQVSYFYIFLVFIIGLTESIPFKISLWLMLAVIATTKNILGNFVDMPKGSKSFL